MKAQIIKPNLQDEFLISERVNILESWNNVSDKSVSIVRARVQPEVITQWHKLIGTDERYLVIRGTGIVSIGELSQARLKQAI